mgnify:CR=1 FL=1|jgi:hypothetical protein
MNNLKTVRMEDHSILMIVSTLIGALGIKEIWGIIKQKIDIGAKREQRQDSIQAQVILQLKDKIESLESRIDVLIQENTQLREKLARVEERLILNAKKKVNRKNNERN